MNSKTLRKLSILIVVGLLVAHTARSEEGMWIPLLLKKYKIEDMQKAGFKLTAEDIYSVNQASMKDAIVRFGGCTAELISDQGLLITNHHCGYGHIQRHSTVENDYLTYGFWAMNRDEELPNPGASATFLIRIEDVTEKVMKGVTSQMEVGERNQVINQNSRRIEQEAIENAEYTSRVSSFFSGNQFFLFIYEVYRDVRLVGAPPSAIGKFGGETDNWMWPRHTGDFSLFRIYASPDNKPAPYSEENVPYTPKKYFPISLKGVNKGDFTMVFGYPGRTTEYIPSFSIENQVNHTIPASIDLVTQRLEIFIEAMEISPKIRLQYSAKKSGIANGWKKNQGILLGLKRLDAINKKIEFEKRFQQWAENDSYRNKKYGNLLVEYKEIVTNQAPYDLANVYARSAGQAAEIIGFAGRFSSFISNLKEGNIEEANNQATRLTNQVERHFKDYHAPTDHRVMGQLLQSYVEDMDESFQPDYLREINTKYNGDLKRFADEVFAKSYFVDKEQVLGWLTNPKKSLAKKLENDPAYLMYQSIQALTMNKIRPGLQEGRQKLPELQRLYMAAQMEMQPEKLFYPDANSTVRVTFGQIDNFLPADGVSYKHYTTLKGIIEKDNPDIYDYRVPEKLKALYYSKDYGKYGIGDEMPVCFIASNHTSGGNSGSPVINADGHLIGVNFDRNWEGTMSDIMYDPDMCRNISIDIRYALFLIDKFAGAKHLIKELDLRE